MEACIAGNTNTFVSQGTVCGVSESEAKAALVVLLYRMPPNTRDGHSFGAASYILAAHSRDLGCGHTYPRGSPVTRSHGSLLLGKMPHIKLKGTQI